MLTLEQRAAKVDGPVDVVNPSDFAELYRAYAPRVSSWVRRLGGPQADAEDLTQEVFTVVLRRLESFDGERGAVGAWLYGITVKVVQGARRKKRVRQWLTTVFGSGQPEASGSHTASPEAQLVAGQAKQTLYRMLDQLPEAQRTAFILFELEEMDGPAIAAVTKTSVANVWVRLHRARRLLQQAAASDEREEGSARGQPSQP